MAKDFKLEMHAAEDSSPGSPGGGPKPGLLGSKLKLLAAMILVTALAGAGVAWFMVSRIPAGAVETAVPAATTEEGMISRSRALDILEKRKQMRETNRSSHNQDLVGETGAVDMVQVATRGELTLVSGLFQHYVQTTASIFELGRIVTNNYVENRAQVEQLYLTQVKPTFDMAERRREVLKNRISHDPALQLYKDIAYIAYHDSLAVVQLSAFVAGGGVEEFTKAVDYANTAKLMLRDFWVYYKYDLKEYEIHFEPPVGIWRRYYIAWDIVE